MTFKKKHRTLEQIQGRREAKDEAYRMITHSSLPVRVACATLDVSKSAYYYTKSKKPAVDKDKAILDQIKAIASDFSR